MAVRRAAARLWLVVAMRNTGDRRGRSPERSRAATSQPGDSLSRASSAACREATWGGGHQCVTRAAESSGVSLS